MCVTASVKTKTFLVLVTKIAWFYYTYYILNLSTPEKYMNLRFLII